MQVYTSLQTDNHASTPSLIFFTGRMLFLLLNQQRQSTEGTSAEGTSTRKSYCQNYIWPRINIFVNKIMSVVC